MQFNVRAFAPTCAPILISHRLAETRVGSFGVVVDVVEGLGEVGARPEGRRSRVRCLVG